MLNEKEFLKKCLDTWNNKSKHKMQSLEDAKKVFKEIEKRIKLLKDSKGETTNE